MLNTFRAKEVWNSTLKCTLKAQIFLISQKLKKKNEKIAYAGITIKKFLSNKNLKYTIS